MSDISFMFAPYMIVISVKFLPLQSPVPLKDRCYNRAAF